jgi:hypothetical protein
MIHDSMRFYQSFGLLSLVAGQQFATFINALVLAYCKATLITCAVELAL